VPLTSIYKTLPGHW